MPIRLADLLRLARAKNASDLHILPYLGAMLRVDGRLEQFGELSSAAECNQIAKFLLDDAALRRLVETGDSTVLYRDAELGSFRVHAYRTSSALCYAVRSLANTVPSLESLHLPSIVSSFAQWQNGLIIFTGPTGSGKTTALAALIDSINQMDAKHIITIEDPVEYEHVSRRSIISQRQVGRDVSSFADALKGALRADPDVLLVGEMRDTDTMAAALAAAETGHLVFATLHTGEAAQAVDRIIDTFPSEAQHQVRVQLAQALRAVVCLRLVRRQNGPGRRAAAEVLLVNDAVRNLIRDAKVPQLRNVICTGRQMGMQTLEAHLSELVMRREVSLEAAQAVTDRPEEVRVFEKSAIA